jgi:hypothetical protein
MVADAKYGAFTHALRQRFYERAGGSCLPLTRHFAHKIWESKNRAWKGKLTASEQDRPTMAQADKRGGN